MAAGERLSEFRRDRRRLVERLRSAGIEDLAILHAFDSVPRHHFVPEALQHQAYDDAALPIGRGQTISRPSVHAQHLQLAGLLGGERVLEVGTGSGFQTALLAALGAEVYSVERVESLAEGARARESLPSSGSARSSVDLDFRSPLSASPGRRPEGRPAAPERPAARAGASHELLSGGFQESPGLGRPNGQPPV